MSNMKKVQRSRMMITKSMLGQGYVVCFTDSKTQRNFCYPIDDFHDWLESNTNCLNTSSWKDDGVYNWHYVPQKYFDFLRSIVWVVTGKDIKPLVPNFLKYHFES